jgi:hypothetical protein
MIFESDHATRFNRADVGLTSCFTSNAIVGTTVLFGQPPELLHMEDLVLNTSLSALQGSLSETAKQLIKEMSTENSDPCTSDKRLLGLLRVFGMELFPDLLYE